MGATDIARESGKVCNRTLASKQGPSCALQSDLSMVCLDRVLIVINIVMGAGHIQMMSEEILSIEDIIPVSESFYLNAYYLDEVFWCQAVDLNLQLPRVSVVSLNRSANANDGHSFIVGSATLAHQLIV
jgi:hypothetical protein